MNGTLSNEFACESILFVICVNLKLNVYSEYVNIHEEHRLINSYWYGNSVDNIIINFGGEEILWD